MKRFLAICMALVLLVSTFQMPAWAQESAAVAQAMTPVYTQEDTEDSWKDAIEIQLTGDGATCANKAVDIDGATVTIEAGGTYIVRGTLEGGQLIVKAGDTQSVHLILDGATISSSSGAALIIKKTAKAVITLAKGSINTLTDSENYTF